MADATLFRGFVVHFWNHETRQWETDTYDTYEKVAERFDDLTEYEGNFPTAEQFADDLYEIFGDRVEWVKDLDATMLYDNTAEIEQLRVSGYFRF